ncbi:MULTISPECIES: hypothetical protein [Bacteroides]|uniref:hypothetical protein n=1 Tax=Bacteroides TaxID=816 RepID=UPI001F208B19|nr:MULTISPECIES: hypothetical protein [Bacteroides]
MPVNWQRCASTVARLRLHTKLELYSTLPHNTLLQANREIGRHLQFITQLASNVGFLKQLEGILCYHLQNVEGLLKKLKEESITAL